MSNNLTPFGPCAAMIIESQGGNVAPQILLFSSLADSNTGTERKMNVNDTCIIRGKCEAQ